MKEMTLVEIHNVQIEILQKIHDFCKERGLRYSLGGGTLLGAVRHQGYIPWDDDIDIMVPRPDYNILINEFQVDNGGITVQDYHTDERFPLIWARFFDNRTKLVSTNSVGGVFVDVFPIDGLPTPDKILDYRKKMLAYKVKLRRTTRLHSDALHELRKVSKLHSNIIYYYLKYSVSKVIYPKRQMVIKEIDNFFNTYFFDTSNYAGAIVGTYGEKEYMEAEVFKSYTELPFEGRMFMCIENYDAYLKKHYGDYMQLPPKEKQVTHHRFKVYWKEK